MLLTTRSMQLRRCEAAAAAAAAPGGSAGSRRRHTGGQARTTTSPASPAAASFVDDDRRPGGTLSPLAPNRAAVRAPPALSPLRAYDWSKSGGAAATGVGVVGGVSGSGLRRFAASEDAEATDQLVGVVGRALATDPVTLAYALPGKEQRYCEAALRAGLLTDAVGRDRRLWLSDCGRAAAVAYLAAGGAGATRLPRPPPLPLLAGAQRAALTAQALTSLKPGEPARACARAATALARVRAAYCAAVERSAEDDAGEAAVVAYVSVLAVDPPAQGRGLGTRLLRDVLRELLMMPLSAAAAATAAAVPALGEEDAATAAPPVLRRHAYVEASSKRSAALYRRLGFRVIASVDADGGVRAGSGVEEAGGLGEAAAATTMSGAGEEEYIGGRLPRAPTLVMAAELKGRFEEWLMMED